VSPIALFGVSLGVLFLGAVVAAVTARVNVTVPDRGMTPGRVAALVALLAMGAGVAGSVVGVAMLLS
jgi:hypothetical protein